MATVERKVGTQTVAGTLYTPNCSLFLVSVKNNDGDAVDLRTEDGSTADINLGLTVEAIVKEIGPLAYFVTDSAAGTIHIVMDKNANASDLQTRIRAIGVSESGDDGSTIIGPNNKDISGSTVAAATSFTVA